MKSKNEKSKNFWDEFRFEFILYIKNGRRKDDGDNIVCQRRFDVRGFNENVINSEELKELMDNITSMNTMYGTPGIIPNYFKQLSVDNLWSFYKPHILYTTSENNKNIFENEDTFIFEIKMDNKTVAKSVFSGNWFETDVRYTVDIRKIIPEIVKEIQFYFSKKEYTIVYETV
jgi:hypothetical protein